MEGRIQNMLRIVRTQSNVLWDEQLTSQFSTIYEWYS